jgi:hypothetical protein
MTDVEITESNIKIKSGDTEVKIEPPETGKLITRALVDLQEKGFPSNDELNTFGDQLFALVGTEIKNIGDKKTKKIVESLQNVVEDVKSTVSEINKDSSLQKIVENIKEEVKNPSLGVDVSEEAEDIMNRLKELVPMMISLGRSIITDYSFRELLLSIIDIIQSKVQEVKENVNDTDIVEVLKQDIRDTSQTIPERTKETIKEKVDDIKNLDVEVTEYDKEEVKDNVIEMLISIKEKPQYKTFFENLFVVYDEMISIWNKISTKPELQQAYEDSTHFFFDIKTLFERVSGRSLKDFEYYFKELANTYEEIKDSQISELRQDFEDLLVDRNNKYITEDAIRRKLEDIKSKLVEIKDQYGDVVENVINEIAEMFRGIAKDPTITKLVEDVNHLVLTIFSDKNGNPSPMVALDSLARIKDFFLPIFMEKMKNLALPLIRVETDRYYYTLSNVNLNATEIMPEMIKIDTESDVTLDIKKNRRKGFLRLKFNIAPINIEIDKLGFTVTKKTGHYSDYGIVDLIIRDASFTLEFLLNVEYDNVARIELTKCESSLGHVKLHIVEAKHDLWDKFITSIFMPGIKKRITSKIDETLSENINGELLDRVNDALKRAERRRQDKLKVKKLKDKIKKTHISIHKEEQETVPKVGERFEVTVKNTQNTQV